MSKEFHLISVGKLKDKNLSEIERRYLSRITYPKLLVHEVKSHGDDSSLEGKEVIAKIDQLSNKGQAYIVLLKEIDKKENYMDSYQFSEWLSSIIEKENRTVIFILGGAKGHGEVVLERAKKSGFTLSLSKLTFPHELARVIFIEQYYRAQTIRSNHPYHN